MFVSKSSQAPQVPISDSKASSAGPIGEGGTSFQDALKQLTDYTKGSTGDQMEKMALAQLGVTPEQLAKMTPKEREKVMEKVHELMKKEMTAQTEAIKAKISTKIDIAV